MLPNSIRLLILLGCGLAHWTGSATGLRLLPNRSHWVYSTPNDAESDEFDNLVVYYNTSGLHCESEMFEHQIITHDNETARVQSRWKRTRVGEWRALDPICLLPNGLPLTRFCAFVETRFDAAWLPIEGEVSCLRQTNEKIISRQLNALHEEIMEGKRELRQIEVRRQVTEAVAELLEVPNHKLLPADVHLTTQILKEVAASSKDAELSSEMVGICSTLMTGNERVLRRSALLNATNSLLDTFETYMDALPATIVPQSRCGNPLTSTVTTLPSGAIPARHNSVVTLDLSYMGVGVELTPNISVFFVNPMCANLSGVAIYDGQAERSALNAQEGKKEYFHSMPGNFYFRFIYMNQSTDELMAESGLQVAAFLTPTLWEHLVAYFGREREPLLVFKVYSHDALFVEQQALRTRKPFSQILSISVPNYQAKFPEPMPFLLRNQRQQGVHDQALALGSGCGYWNYHTWVNEGVHTDTADPLNTPVILCGTRHLTQFSFLLGGNYRQNDISDDILVTPLHEQVLDIITLVGCTLSLLGLCGIWLTAAIFPSWRCLASTKILLNLCLALSLQMVLFVFVDTGSMSEHLIEEHGYAKCVLLGAALQYSILVLFLWMLVVAFLQFQRYVTVIGIARPRHYILKSALVAWGLPLIVTLIVALSAPRSYIPTSYQLDTETGVCYPSGLALTFGVVVPITLIVAANLFIFIYVFYSISRTLAHASQHHERHMVIKQIRLSVLLFFLLGLSWIFGLLAFMKAGLVFSYLFCLTATLQGFVLFVFFVLLDDITRTEWRHLLRPSTRRQDAERKTLEMQSMTTSTALDSTTRPESVREPARSSAPSQRTPTEH